MSDPRSMIDARSRIAQRIAARLGGTWRLQPLHLSGFCDTWRAQAGDRSLFVKSGATSMASVLQAEKNGLEALAATHTIRVPGVQGYWSDDEGAVLALEWLDLASPAGEFGRRFGHALAALHLAVPAGAAGRFGWCEDTRIGATPQPNAWSVQTGKAGWIEFLAAQRLLPMRKHLAARNAPAELLNAIDAVVTRLPALFADGHVPRPSLIHGDLWSGNWGMLADGTPVIYDPAVSCSDAEAELAMMELFGSPPAGFWTAYREHIDIAQGYEHRRGLYQLYHLLNHAVLFGGGYVRQALVLAGKIVSS